MTARQTGAGWSLARGLTVERRCLPAWHFPSTLLSQRETVVTLAQCHRVPQHSTGWAGRGEAGATGAKVHMFPSLDWGLWPYSCWCNACWISFPVSLLPLLWPTEKLGMSLEGFFCVFLTLCSDGCVGVGYPQYRVAWRVQAWTQAVMCECLSFFVCVWEFIYTLESTAKMERYCTKTSFSPPAFFNPFLGLSWIVETL